MNRISCADFTFPLLPHDSVFQLISLLGCDGVDLGVFRGRSHFGPDHLLRGPSAAGKEMAERVARHGLSISDVFLQVGPEPRIGSANDPDQSVRKRGREDFARAVEFAAAAGCRHLTGLPGVIHSGQDDPWAFSLAAEESAWRLESAAAAGITYGIEPHVGSLCGTPESTLRLLKMVPGLTLTLDYGHFIYQNQPLDPVHPLIDHASHFHARGGAPGKLQATMAENQINFPDILTRMQQAGYAGWICLEYVWVDWEGCNRTDNVSETIRLRDLLKVS